MKSRMWMNIHLKWEMNQAMDHMQVKTSAHQMAWRRAEGSWRNTAQSLRLAAAHLEHEGYHAA
jgi:hypothetical protein